MAGYNIKMAFVIQDLKNLDEIYGETSRHSLMGNCGYQLVFGANDQVTAEAVSKGLGKRTVRYKTESRTIELMGLHRRTKVEQLRERDLMMPQEVRQMPQTRWSFWPRGRIRSSPTSYVISRRRRSLPWSGSRGQTCRTCLRQNSCRNGRCRQRHLNMLAKIPME